MATRAYNKTLVLDASFTLIKASTDSRLGQLDTSANSFTTRLGNHDTSIAKLDASATSFTTRLGSHDTILDKLDGSASNYKVRLDQLDTSANSFTGRLAGHDTSISKLDASATHFTTRLGVLDTSANSFTNRLSVLDGSFNSLTLQSLFNNSTWDEDVSGALIKLDVSSTYIINNFYDKVATRQLLDGSLNSLKANYIDSSVNTLKTYTDLSLNELKTYIEGHYYTSARIDVSFANVLIVSSHTSRLNQLDTSANSFTSRLGQLDTSVNIVEGAITSQYSQISALQTSTGKLDVSATSFTTRLGQLDTSANSFTTRLGQLDASTNQYESTWTTWNNASINALSTPYSTGITQHNKYKVVGSTVHVLYNLFIESTLDATGEIHFSIPFAPKFESGSYPYILGTASFYDVSGSTNIYTGIATSLGASPVGDTYYIRLSFSTKDGPVYFTNNSPVDIPNTPSGSNILSISLTYEKA